MPLRTDASVAQASPMAKRTMKELPFHGSRRVDFYPFLRIAHLLVQTLRFLELGAIMTQTILNM